MIEHSGTTAGDRMTKHDKHGGLRMCVCVRPVCMCVPWTTAPRPERESPRPQQPLADADEPQHPLRDATEHYRAAGVAAAEAKASEALRAAACGAFS